MPTTTTRVPFHSLGISQIIAFGLLFYVFAQLKTPLALYAGVGETDVLYAVSGALLLQTFLAPSIGSMIDRRGALYVMARGLVIGAIGMGALPLFPSIIWIWVCMVPVGIGFAMSSYETAFSAAVKIDETRARRNISYITFYGGVASSLTWVSVAPLLTHGGLMMTCGVIAFILLAMAWRVHMLSCLGLEQATTAQKGSLERFSWSSMTRRERGAIVILGTSSSLENMLFACTSLLWISWFNIQFNDLGLAVLLASIYGPFQVVGRVLEMQFGSKIDARITGLTAFGILSLSLFVVQTPTIAYAMLGMAFFGMGHGILTVTYGFVTNLYFKAEVYGRAKGWITVPRGISNALGPTVGGALFLSGQLSFFGAMIILGVCAWLCFAGLLLIKPREDLT